MSENTTKMGLRAKLTFLSDSDTTTIINYFLNRGIVVDEYDDECFWSKDRINEYLPSKYGTDVYVDYLFVYEYPSYNAKAMNISYDILKIQIEEMKNLFNIRDEEIKIFGYTYYGEEPIEELYD